MIKSQIPDGFATIRTRGLTRSKSRAEQMAHARRSNSLQPAGSGPLFENNNDLYYKSASTSLISTPPPVPPRTSSELTINSTAKDDQHPSGPFRDDDDIYYTSALTYETFKPLKSPRKTDSGNYINLTQSTDYIDSLNYDFSLPPLKSPQYINELNLIRTRAMENYRSDSPPYNKVRGSYRSTTPESLDNGSSNSSTYSHPVHPNPKLNGTFGYTIQDTDVISSKPPLSNKALTLQYRKSFNHSNSRSNIIYEEPKKLNGGSDTDSGYDGNYRKIHQNASSELLNLEISTAHLSNRPNNYIRRYATLGHPTRAGDPRIFSTFNHNHNNQNSIGEDQRFCEENGKSTASLNENDLVKLHLLDYKVGCASVLRSRPVIPWYELAIRRDHRQSCPVSEAHVVAAFEQSLANMTGRLQSLTATTEKKDSEILDMRQTIELLRKQSIQAGLTTAHMQSMGVQVNGQVNGSANPTEQSTATATQVPPGAEMQRHHSSDSMCSLNSVSSGCSAQDKKKKKGWLRSSFTKAFSRNAKISKTNRHVTSQSSNLDATGTAAATATTGNGHRHHHHHHHHNGSAASNGNVNGDKVSSKAASASQLPPPSPTKNGSPHKTVTLVENAKPIDAIDVNGIQIVEELKKQLREKDLALTDTRLEWLSSKSQVELMQDMMDKMHQEMMALKQNNERLERMARTRSLAGSEVSLGPVSPSGSMGEPRRYSLATDNGMSRPPLDLPQNLDETEEDNIPPAPAPEPPPAPLSPAIIAKLSPTIERAALVNEILTTPAEDVADPVDGKKIAIAVYLGQAESFVKYAEEMNECDNNYCQSGDEPSEKPATENGDKSRKSFSGGPPDGTNSSPNEFTIAYTYISGKTTWQNLDYIVRKTFKDYLGKIDPGTNLGLNTDSITSYHLGEAKRGPEMGFPELLPCGYIIGNVRSLYICLQGVGSLAFESLILRNIVHRYISLLTEHRRLILCGPSGTGKSYLARKLAEFLVARSGRDNPAEAIATFNVDHKSSKELQQYLGHIAEQASMSEGAVEELPAVIILDNLHHASALGDVFSCLLSATAAKLPCIIGTMSQATCNTTNLQLHHNFRWVLTANHMEPVKGFLGRYLRRKLFTLELSSGQAQPQLEKVLRWLPTVWQHINSFLETHNSSDVTIGPRLFLSCPMNLQDSQVWFTDVWNYHLAPYLMEAVREGVQLYGRRGGTWVDPCSFVRETYPWPVGPTTVPQLRQITADDVGLEASAPANSENQDPLLNMLMRLQEAANYNGNQEPDSDCASLDSNMTHDSSAGAD